MVMFWGGTKIKAWKTLEYEHTCACAWSTNSRSMDTIAQDSHQIDAGNIEKVHCHCAEPNAGG